MYFYTQFLQGFKLKKLLYIFNRHLFIYCRNNSRKWWSTHNSYCYLPLFRKHLTFFYLEIYFYIFYLKALLRKHFENIIKKQKNKMFLLSTEKCKCLQWLLALRVRVTCISEETYSCHILQSISLCTYICIPISKFKSSFLPSPLPSPFLSGRGQGGMKATGGDPIHRFDPNDTTDPSRQRPSPFPN